MCFSLLYPKQQNYTYRHDGWLSTRTMNSILHFVWSALLPRNKRKMYEKQQHMSVGFCHFSTNISLPNGCFVLCIFDAICVMCMLFFFLFLSFSLFSALQRLVTLLMSVCSRFDYFFPMFCCCCYYCCCCHSSWSIACLAIAKRKVHDMRVLTILISIKYGSLINQLPQHESVD